MLGSLSPNPHLEVRDTHTAKGRGVFALKDYAAGEVVEINPVMLLRTHWDDLPRDVKALVFDWGRLSGALANQRYAVALGLGSLFNHQAIPNLDFTADPERDALVFTALTDIPEGSELTIDYNHNAPPGRQDWFQAIGIEPL